MQIKEVMTSNAEFVEPGLAVMAAAQKMKTKDIGSLPVGENDRLIGMVTDRDIATRVVADGKDPNLTTVGDVMTRGIAYCFDDNKVEDAARIMEDKKIRRLVVLNRNKRMVGIVSLGDFARKDNNYSLTGEMLRQISV